MSAINKKLVVSASPHFRAKDTTRSIMLDVIIVFIQVNTKKTNSKNTFFRCNRKPQPAHLQQ